MTTNEQPQFTEGEEIEVRDTGNQQWKPAKFLYYNQYAERFPYLVIEEGETISDCFRFARKKQVLREEPIAHVSEAQIKPSERIKEIQRERQYMYRLEAMIVYLDELYEQGKLSK